MTDFDREKCMKIIRRMQRLNLSDQDLNRYLLPFLVIDYPDVMSEALDFVEESLPTKEAGS